MSNFEKVYQVTMAHEGLYSNNPVDTGGETYMGISRRFHPNWKGWLIIDNYKIHTAFPTILSFDNSLYDLVKTFYRSNFYNPMWEDLPYLLAEELFDNAVNMGMLKSVEFLQRSLNVLNRNGRSYVDLKVDGAYGRITHQTINSFLKNDQIELLLKYINVLQGYHYISIMERNATQQTFARGWFNRVEFKKNKVETKTKIDKEIFVDCINSIQQLDETNIKLANLLGADMIGYNSNLINKLIQILEINMADSGNWIDYYIWELDYGKRKDLGAFREDGSSVKLESAEDLYDFLMEK